MGQRRSASRRGETARPRCNTTLHFITVVELILQALVFICAYKITKITGSFQSWTLIRAAFAILTVRNAISLLLTLTIPPDQVSSLIESIGITITIVSSIVNLVGSVTLFLGFFDLVKRFQNQPKPL